MEYDLEEENLNKVTCITKVEMLANNPSMYLCISGIHCGSPIFRLWAFLLNVAEETLRAH